MTTAEKHPPPPVGESVYGRPMAGRASKTQGTYHCVGTIAGPDGTARAACSYRTTLVDGIEAATVPLQDRCQRQGCKQLWPDDLVEDFL